MALKKSEIRKIVEASDEDVSKSEKIQQILDLLHTEVDTVKDELDEARESLKKSEDRVKELEKNAGDNSNDWKDKYEKERDAFKQYKKEQSDKEALVKKTTAYKELLKQANVGESTFDSVIKASRDAINALEFDEEGKLKNSDELMNAIKTDWAGFIVRDSQKGADTQKPPRNSGGKLTNAEIYAKDEHGRYKLSSEERQKAIAQNLGSE